MSSKEYWMRRAIDLARYCHTPYAAIITDEKGKLIAQKANTVIKDTDPTAHAEINAIRKACALRKSIKLKGCVIYSTVEPCAMCASAIAWSGIDKVVFGATIGDVISLNGNQFNLSLSDFYESIDYNADITPYYLRDECEDLVRQFNRDFA